MVKARRHRASDHAAGAHASGGFVTFRLDGVDYDCSELPYYGPPIAYRQDGGPDKINGAYWRAVKTVACPKCLASGGSDCTTPAGDWAAPHAARMARALGLGRILGPAQKVDARASAA